MHSIRLTEWYVENASYLKSMEALPHRRRVSRSLVSWIPLHFSSTGSRPQHTGWNLFLSELSFVSTLKSEVTAVKSSLFTTSWNSNGYFSTTSVFMLADWALALMWYKLHNFLYLIIPQTVGFLVPHSHIRRWFFSYVVFICWLFTP